MTQKNRTVTKILAIVGTALVWFPILAPILLSLALAVYARIFHFDYLTPAELFPLVVLGGALLLWAAQRARLRLKAIAWSFGTAMAVLATGMLVAVTTGLASGATEPTGIWWAVALVSIMIYTAAVLGLAVSGALLLRDLFGTS